MNENMADKLLLCYNKGCGKQFDPAENKQDSCTFHSGVPVFHDALKGWSCCKKRSTDFTEFLNIPGCSKGPHTNEKPKEPEKPVQSESSENEKPEAVIVKAHLPDKPEDLSTRPSEDEPMVRLKSTVGATLKQALEKQMQNINLNDKSSSECATESTAVKVGESCKNSGCKKSYEGPHSNEEECVHHPGFPIFHEGMKYWSCCQRKTSEFSNFLEQEGCETGHHLWVKKDKDKKVACRYDWHQTGPFVTVSVFSKLAVPEESWVEANRVAVKIFITFDGGKSVFEKHIVLRKVIDPSLSSVKLLGAKVEVNLRKAEPGSWPTLEKIPMEEPKPAEKDN